MNLLKETIDAIRKAGQPVTAITFIGSVESGHTCSWAKFRDLADFEYSNGHNGFREIPSDLVIVFEDGSWLRREEYDSAEWWEYVVPPLDMLPKLEKKALRRLRPSDRRLYAEPVVNDFHG